MSAEDETYNLTALAARLLADGKHTKLAHRIRRAQELHSLTSDLEMALESLDALKESLKVPVEQHDLVKGITEAALLNNAIMLYARATKTKSDERSDYDLRPKFTDPEKAVHNELCDLRDKAIAHFGSGGSYSGEWQAELVLLHFKNSVGKVAVTTNRQTVDGKLVARARLQIETSHELLRKISLAMVAEVSQLINDAFASDAAFGEEIAKHPLNLSVFMRSQAAKDHALAAFDQTYAKGMVSRK